MPLAEAFQKGLAGEVGRVRLEAVLVEQFLEGMGIFDANPVGQGLDALHGLVGPFEEGASAAYRLRKGQTEVVVEPRATVG